MDLTKNLLKENLPYYHTQLVNYKKVEEILNHYRQKDGFFLLRNSQSIPGSVTLSVTHQDVINHINVSHQNGMYFLKNKKFKTVGALVENYAREDVPNQENIKHIRFLYPICNGLKSHSENNSFPTVQKHPDLQVSTVSRSVSLNELRDRAPAPLPTHVQDMQSRNLPQNETVYVYADSGNIDRTPLLIDSLRQLDRTRCECGLLVRESQLADDWTVHITPEGKLFFIDGDNVSAWNLPESVFEQLDEYQKEMLENLSNGLKPL